jgi:basic membrane lipoprotein Med (substrate-binding protein (PBP1-ABC) superfamily)
VWGHSVYPDAIQALGPKYPNIAFVGAGSGYAPMGKNMYWVDMHINEAAYLIGMLAGKMTKSNVLGAVAAYPYENVNEPINAFFEGAKSVNPNIKIKMNYISSWYDPAKAKEAALSEIAAGADYVYAERFGPFEAATEKGVFAFGHYTDQNSLAPDTVVSSTLAKWDPVINSLIDAWWNHTVNGTAYDASTTSSLYFLMKDGASDIAPFHGFDSKIPQDVKDLIAKTRADILAGKMDVKANGNEVKGD